MMVISIKFEIKLKIYIKFDSMILETFEFSSFPRNRRVLTFSPTKLNVKSLRRTEVTFIKLRIIKIKPTGLSCEFRSQNYNSSKYFSFAVSRL